MTRARLLLVLLAALGLFGLWMLEKKSDGGEAAHDLDSSGSASADAPVQPPVLEPPPRKEPKANAGGTDGGVRTAKSVGIRARVETADGTVLPGAQVLIEPRARRSFRLVTDETGVIQCELTDADFPFVARVLGSKHGGYKAFRSRVARRSAGELLIWTVEARITIRGRLLDDLGRPVRNGRVVAANLARTRFRGVRADASGNFEVDRLNPKEEVLLLGSESQDYEALRSLSGWVRATAGAIDIEVPEGQDPSVVVRIESPTEVGVVEIRVLRRDDPEFGQSTKVSLTKNAAGTWTAEATMRGLSRDGEYYLNARAGSADLVAHGGPVRAGEVVLMRLQTGRRVSGRITVEGQESSELADLEVVAWGHSHVVRGRRVGKSEYEVTGLPAGESSILLRGRIGKDYYCCLKTITPGARIDVILAPGGVIEGRISSRVTVGRVRVAAWVGRYHIEQRLGGAAAFKFAGLPEGSWRVTAFARTRKRSYGNSRIVPIGTRDLVIRLR